MAKQNLMIKSISASALLHALPLALAHLTLSQKPDLTVAQTLIEVHWQTPKASEALPSNIPKAEPISLKKQEAIPKHNTTPKIKLVKSHSADSGQQQDYTGYDIHQPPEFANRKPDYPEEARLLGIEGTVLLKVIISPLGTVRNVQVLEPKSHHLLEKAALAQIKSWRFPKSPLGQSIILPIKFELE